MRKYLLGSVVAAAAVLSISFVILPRITPQLNAAKPRAAVSTPDLDWIWSPPRSLRLPAIPLPRRRLPPMQPWAAKRCDAIGCGKGTLAARWTTPWTLI